MTDRLDAAQFERHMHRELAREASAAMAALERVERVSWLWADGVRACVEERAGLSFEDGRVLDDPAYGAALDGCAQLSTLKSALEQALEHLQAAPAIDMSASPIVQQAEAEAER